MEIAIAVILLIVSLFLVIKGGDIFVNSATDISKRLHIPQLIFGATLVSLATTLPELVIAILSSIDGTTGLAVGNAVGSVLCNIGLICGIAFVIMPSDMSRGGCLKYYLNIVVVIFLSVIVLFKKIEIWQAFVLLSFTILFFIFNVIDAKSMSKSKKSKEKSTPPKPIWLTIIMFILGGAAIGGGAYLLVQKVEFLSKVIGISEQFVGLTIIAIGTSLPELITVISAIKKKTPYLAIGNIIGSNILNLALILSTARLTAWNYDMAITSESAYVSMPLALLFTLLMILPILFKKQTYRWQGILLLSLYVGYIVFLVCNIIFKIL